MRLLIASLLLLAAFAAQADDDEQCTQEPIAKWKPLWTAVKKAEDAGHHPKVAQIHDHCYVISGVDRAGNRFEWRLNPVTLEAATEKK